MLFAIIEAEHVGLYTTILSTNNLGPNKESNECLLKGYQAAPSGYKRSGLVASIDEKTPCSPRPNALTVVIHSAMASVMDNQYAVLALAIIDKIGKPSVE